MHHMRIGFYKLSPGTTLDEVLQAAKQGMLPIFRRLAGFVSYEIVGVVNGFVSISRWETQEAADRAAESAADFVRDTLADKVILERNLVGGVAMTAMASASAPQSTPSARA